MSADTDADRQASMGERLVELERRVGTLDRENAYLKKALFALAGEGASLDDLPDALGGLGEAVRAHEHRLEDLEGEVNPDPDSLDYEDMSRRDKARVIREALVEDARRNGGKAKFNYKEIRQRLDGRPSPGHAYTIMEDAAEAEGFEYGKDGVANEKRVKVDLDELEAANGDRGLSRRE